MSNLTFMITPCLYQNRDSQAREENDATVPTTVYENSHAVL